MKPITFTSLKDYKSWKSNISCFSYNDKELYIDSHKNVYPCCIIGSMMYNNYDIELYKKYNLFNENSITPIAREIQLNSMETVRELNGPFLATETSIKDIMNSESWETLLRNKWTDNSSYPCTVLCGDKTPFLKIQDQVNRAE